MIQSTASGSISANGTFKVLVRAGLLRESWGVWYGACTPGGSSWAMMSSEGTAIMRAL
jgi:hypothetical protein